MDEREKVLAYVKDDIKPYYFENAVAWVLDNCDILDRESVPHIFGSGTPLQTAFENHIIKLLGKE